MALAPVAYVLYTRAHEAQPGGPALARPRPLRPLCGHASMLLYSMLYLTGYGLTLDDLKKLPPARLAHRRAIPSTATPPASRSPPARSGQGISNAVGMALAERMLAARFNRDGHDVVDHHTYVICSDGDLRRASRREACVARRAPRARPPDRLLRRQPHHDRGRHRARLLRGRAARATRPTAGTCRTSARTSTLDRLEEAVAGRPGRHGPARR